MHIVLLISILINTSYHTPIIHTLLCYSDNNYDTLLKDKKSLIKYAEPILFKKYGKDLILSEKPYVITSKNGIWTMGGTLPKQYTMGGTFHIEITAKDGKVIYIIHYK
jgi:hypothetical protein